MGVRDWFRRKGPEFKKSYTDELEKLVPQADKYYGELNELKDKVATLEAEVRFHKEQSAAWERKHSEAQTRLDRYQTEATSKTREDMQLRYNEVSGEFPILWVNSLDPTVVNERTFANIRAEMARMAPKVKFIILTYGDVRLYELDDVQLEKLGLARITGRTGGAIGGPSRALEQKGASKS